MKEVNRETAGVYTVWVIQPSDKQEAHVDMELLLEPGEEGYKKTVSLTH